MQRMLPIFATIGAVLAVQPAIAESRAVTYDDLDLSTRQGQKTLAMRIDRAAREVCGVDAVITGTRVPPPEARECVRQAKRQIEHKLAAVLDRQTGGGKPAHSPVAAKIVP